jgi:hypothetical protein
MMGGDLCIFTDSLFSYCFNHMCLLQYIFLKYCVWQQAMWIKMVVCVALRAPANSSVICEVPICIRPSPRPRRHLPLAATLTCLLSWLVTQLSTQAPLLLLVPPPTEASALRSGSGAMVGGSEPCLATSVTDLVDICLENNIIIRVVH